MEYEVLMHAVAGIDPGLSWSEEDCLAVRLTELPAAKAQRKCSASDLTNPRTMGVQCVCGSAQQRTYGLLFPN